MKISVTVIGYVGIPLANTSKVQKKIWNKFDKKSLYKKLSNYKPL